MLSIVGSDFLLAIRGDTLSWECGNVVWLYHKDCRPDDLVIKGFQVVWLFEHDIGRVLALVHIPVVSLVKSFFYGIKIRGHFMCKEIQPAAEAFGIKFIRKFLCPDSIADLKERIVIHPVMDAGQTCMKPKCLSKKHR